MYADAHDGRLPPAAVCGPDGRPLLSWRVLLLPYIEEDKLFKEFKLDEPWDSEHNLRLLDRMPRSYEAPWKKYVDVPPHHTVLHVFVGSGAAFGWNRGMRIREDFADGTSNTLLFVEAGQPVPWTKPEEIAFDPSMPITLRGLFRDGYRSCAVDGTAHLLIHHDVPDEILRAAITRDGGETSDPPWNW